MADIDELERSQKAKDKEYEDSQLMTERSSASRKRSREVTATQGAGGTGDRSRPQKRQRGGDGARGAYIPWNIDSNEDENESMSESDGLGYMDSARTLASHITVAPMVEELEASVWSSVLHKARSYEREQHKRILSGEDIEDDACPMCFFMNERTTKDGRLMGHILKIEKHLYGKIPDSAIFALQVYEYARLFKDRHTIVRGKRQENPFKELTYKHVYTHYEGDEELGVPPHVFNEVRVQRTILMRAKRLAEAYEDTGVYQKNDITGKKRVNDEKAKCMREADKHYQKMLAIYIKLMRERDGRDGHSGANNMVLLQGRPSFSDIKNGNTVQNISLSSADLRSNVFSMVSTAI